MKKVNKSHPLRHAVRYDLQYGIVNRWFEYLPWLLFVLASCGFLYARVQEFSQAGILNGKITLADYLIFFFCGMEPYNIQSHQPFTIPFVWLISNVYLIILIGNYVQKDLHGFGMQILWRMQHRLTWWIGKCTWVFTTVILYYALAFVGILCFSICTATLSLNPSTEICEKICEIPSSLVDQGHWLTICLFLPMMSAMALSFLQASLSFALKPTGSCLMVLCILVLSAFYNSPFLVGNHSMLIRVLLYQQPRALFAADLVMDLLICLFGASIGYLFLRRFDIVKRQ